MRATPEMRRTIEALTDGLAERLQRPVSMTEAVQIAVSSATAALADGHLPTALSLPPGAASLPAPRDRGG